MTLEFAFSIGKVVAQHAGRLWLAGRAAEDERGRDLIELIRARFPDQIARRRVERQLADIADSVAERLLPFCRLELRDLSDSDITAVLAEVVLILEESDLSDRALFTADADPVKLSRHIRSTMPRRLLEGELGEAGTRLYNAVLDECCDCLVRIVVQLPQFGPRASAEVLARLSGMAEQIALVLNRLPARSLYGPDAADNDEEFTRRYLECVSHTLDTLELFGVHLERLRRPRISLNVAYISLTATEQVTPRQANPIREVPIEDWRRDGSTGGARQAEEVLGDNRLLLLRGEAGAGKSTLLRWVAISAARGRFSRGMADWNGCVPFLIKLRSYSDRELPPPEHFLDGIADHLVGLMPRGWVHRHLMSGRALLLVDGIDELPTTQRHAVREWLNSLVATFPGVRMVVTSRPAAAGAEWLRAEGFTSAFLERMSPAAITRLVQHWHTAVRDRGDLPCPREKLPAYEAALLARLEAAPNLRMLATNPLLASMLCALNLDRDSRLPRDRMGLYAATLEMLLEARDAKRSIPSARAVILEPEQKIRILQDLAWQLSTSNRVELPKTTVQRLIAEKLLSMPRVNGEAETVLEYLLQRSGVLREPVPGRIDFIHRTVQEYLAAKQAADIGDMDFLVKSAHRDQWRETVIMAAGHANEPLRRELLTGLLERIRIEPGKAKRLKLLIVACLETLPAIPTQLREDIDRCLNDLVPPHNIASARLLATAGEPVLMRLPANLEDLPERVAVAAIRAAWLINGPEALNVLSRYASDERYGVQAELSKAWEYFDPDEFAERVLSKNLSRGRRLTVYHSVGQFKALAKVPRVSELDIWLNRLPNLGFLLPHVDWLTSLSLSLGEPIADFTVLSKCKKLTFLALQGTMELGSIDFLTKMQPLTGIWFTDCAQVTDYSALANHTSLNTLVLFNSPGLTDLAVLPPLHSIRSFGLSRSGLSCKLGDLVDQTPRLYGLYLDSSDWVDDLSPLAGLPVQDLRLHGCKAVEDVGPLANLTRLSFLDVSGSKVHDLSPLAGLSKLSNLRLMNCKRVTDLSPLASLRNLRELIISDIAPDVDLLPLANNRRLMVRIRQGQIVRNAEALGGRLEIAPRWALKTDPDQETIDEPF